jgi:hypothetical protein
VGACALHESGGVSNAFADLDPQEARSRSKLQELKVPYQLEVDGRTIKVASDKIAKLEFARNARSAGERPRRL